MLQAFQYQYLIQRGLLSGMTLCACLFFLLFLFLPAPASAFNVLKMTTADDEQVSWNLNADRVVAVAGGSVLEASGKVELSNGSDYMRADFARYYTNSKWIYLHGNIEVSLDGDRLRATEAEFDLSGRTGWLVDGEMFLKEPNAYFYGERITKHWGERYSFTNAKVTTCNGETPAWSLTADKAVVEVNSYAQLWDTAFKISDVPVMYVPYMIMPAKTERQSGFLPPEAGHSSMNGTYYNQPFFWALDDSRDLTLNEYYMSKRGFMHGATYRSRGSEDEMLWLRFDWLKDRRTITNDLDDKYYRNDGLIRTNSSRYWLRGMYEWRLPADPLLRVRADIDYTSDQYFLRDFRNGLSGFNASRDELFNTFSRDLKEIDQDRLSKVMLFREWERASVYLLGSYTQDPALGNGNLKRSRDNSVQHMPELNAYLHKGRIVKSIPLELEANAQTAYMYRRDGTKGARFDVSPKITLPLVSEYGSVLASGELKATWYNTNNESGSPNNTNGDRPEYGKKRVLPKAEVLASTEFSRVYDFNTASQLIKAGDSEWGAVKHSIVPRVSYINIVREDQEKNPYYDEYDRIETEHMLSISLENNITRRRDRAVPRKNAKNPADFDIQSDYLKVFSFELQQSYDIREARRDDNRAQHARRPYSDIMLKTAIYADEHLNLWNKSYWSPYTNEFTRHTHGATLSLPSLSLSTSLDHLGRVNNYKFQREKNLTVMKNSASFDLLDNWSTSAYYNWSIKGDAATEKGLSLDYNHQCFKIRGRFTRDGGDTSWGISFSLSGFSL